MKMAGLRLRCTLGFLLFVANIVEIIVFIRSKKKWTNAYILFFNLAITDSTLRLTTAITDSVLLLNNYHSTAMKVMKNIMFYSSIRSSCFIAILLSIDVMDRSEMVSGIPCTDGKKAVIYWDFLSWVLGGVVCSSVFIINTKVAKDYEWAFIGGPIIVFQTLLVVYLYSSIFRQFRKSARSVQMKVDYSHRSNRNSEREINQGSWSNKSNLEGNEYNKIYSLFGSDLPESQHFIPAKGDKSQLALDKLSFSCRSGNQISQHKETKCSRDKGNHVNFPTSSTSSSFPSEGKTSEDHNFH